MFCIYPKPPTGDFHDVVAAFEAGMPSLLNHFFDAEASVEEIQRKPLPEVASMAYDERFQEVVDWVEEHKAERYVETATVGLGSPTVTVSAFSSFPLDTDFGFGDADRHVSREAVQIAARSCGDGSWFASAFVWRRRSSPTSSACSGL
ncbi:hypothetical protein E2562_001653 [Oryza meyeriana var. granulata]|uniref:Uncharacterized protein n=1 Tax=Oryza meyeriana var. granulata TaxID=110450 RepID=A0A6G1CCN8_9ORYZ|nr:hypothetical protein E2562_001653 [Oryza meyeriana var. granulata]